MAVFSEACKQLFLRAGELAHQWGHSYIGTEPLLLILLDDPSGLVAELCRKGGVDPQVLRADVVGVIRRGGPPLPGGTSAITPQLREALDFAIAEADSLSQPEVKAEHLLLGMLRQGADGIGVAGYLMSQRGLQWKTMRDLVEPYPPSKS